MEQFIKITFDDYFNSTLRNILEYPETFTINVNLDSRKITLISNLPSKLIQLLRVNKELFNKLNEQLLISFQRRNPDIGSVQINLIGDTIIQINYQVTFLELSQIDIAANIAKDLNLQELTNLCEYNPRFEQTCNSQSFWIQLFKNRFGDVPNFIQGVVDYKRLYIDILMYIEFKENMRSELNKLRLPGKFILNISDEEYKLHELNMKPYRDKASELNLELINIINDLSVYSIIYLIYINKLKVYADEFINSKHSLNLYIIKSVSNLKTNVRFIDKILPIIFRKAFTNEYDENLYNLSKFLLYSLNKDNHITIRELIILIQRSIVNIIRKKGRDKLYFNDDFLNLLENYIKTENTSFNIREHLSDWMPESRNDL